MDRIPKTRGFREIFHKVRDKNDKVDLNPSFKIKK